MRLAKRKRRIVHSAITAICAIAVLTSPIYVPWYGVPIVFLFFAGVWAYTGWYLE